MQNFAEIPIDPPEEIFRVFIFAEGELFKPHPYQMITTQEARANLEHPKSVSQNRRQRSEEPSCYNMTASSFPVEAMVRGHYVYKDILFIFFAVLFSRLPINPRKSRKFAPSENFPLYGNWWKEIKISSHNHGKRFSLPYY